MSPYRAPGERPDYSEPVPSFPWKRALFCASLFGLSLFVRYALGCLGVSLVLALTSGCLMPALVPSLVKGLRR